MRVLASRSSTWPEKIRTMWNTPRNTKHWNVSVWYLFCRMFPIVINLVLQWNKESENCAPMKYFVLTCFWIYVWVSNVTATKYEAYRKEPHDTYCRALIECDMILRNIVLTTRDGEKIQRTNMCTSKSEEQTLGSKVVYFETGNRELRGCANCIAQI